MSQRCFLVECFSIVSASCSAVADFLLLSLQALTSWGWAGKIWSRSVAQRMGFASSTPWKEGETVRKGTKHLARKPVSARAWNFYCQKTSCECWPKFLLMYFQVYSAPSDHLCVSAARQNPVQRHARGRRQYVHGSTHAISRNDSLRARYRQFQPLSFLILPLCSLPGSVPGGADPAGPVREDRSAVRHHPAADHTRVPTNPQRDPHTGLRRGNGPAHLLASAHPEKTHTHTHVWSVCEEKQKTVDLFQVVQSFREESSFILSSIRGTIITFRLSANCRVPARRLIFVFHFHFAADETADSYHVVLKWPAAARAASSPLLPPRLVYRLCINASWAGLTPLVDFSGAGVSFNSGCLFKIRTWWINKTEMMSVVNSALEACGSPGTKTHADWMNPHVTVNKKVL